MDLQKSNMTVLAQIVKLIPAKIIDFLAKKYKIQSRAFSPTSHVVSLLYEHLAHSLSLNDVCDSLQYHSGMLSQIRRCTPPTAKDSDPKTAPELCSGLKAGEIAVFDKVYVDFKHLNSLDKRGTFRVTRKKENMVYEVM